MFEKEYGPAYRKQELPIGDIFIPERGLLFERKEYADLVSSVYSKHLEKQAYELEKTGLHAFIIVVGTIEDFHIANQHRRAGRLHWTLDHHFGLIMSKIHQYPRLHWVFAKNNSQLLTAVNKAILKYENDATFSIDTTELMARAKLQVEDKESIQARCLAGVPDIGPGLARSILKQVGPFRHLITMSQEELEKLEGVGPVRAKKILDAFL